jgi:hypothetical protein
MASELNREDAIEYPLPAFSQSGWWGHLHALALNGLVSMFDEKLGLFCFIRKLSDSQIMNAGFSRRYSLMALLGLQRLKSYGAAVPLPINLILDRIADSWGKLDDAGDFGLLLWTSALASPSRMELLLDQHDPDHISYKCRDVRAGMTTELAWLLTGLSYAALHSRMPNSWSALARQVHENLIDNCGPSGLFGHRSNRSLQTPFRARIGCFADQAYPIYALSLFAQAFNEKSALNIARRCGEAIIRLQGDMGQWWWQYDSLKGEVVGRYPVYSVHQDGMAPMALRALSKAADISFDEPIEKGLEWISGRNELGFNMLDPQRDLIWRAIRPSKWIIGSEMLRRMCRFPFSSYPQGLSVWYECRPYHLGWLLYAFADRMASNSADFHGEQTWTKSSSGSQRR